ncbi:glycan-binding surface protein [Mucilaginibacter sp. UR6-1]|uniref:glycan-binding surface protein n=1 Tax=Mucilaginibacter sp. UR6-1 TaxID=1435643 RepID=UPI001E41FB89|nr:glycan-binding surface protein [Mucilaginibacter sp. UR6-1]MCC8408580.1 glycan-binding surface protein [Mucilaginibacter sp. UR6-1]
MKNSSLTIKAIVYLALVSTMALFSCKKNQSAGPPTITGFRLYAQSPLDSVIAEDADIKAIRPGDMIVIQGNNLDNMRAVFFNGFPAAINTAFSSKNNFVVEVPGNIPFATIPEADFNTVKVVTEGGTVIKKFPIVAPKPIITGISNEMPNPGETITLYGSGLFAVTKLTLPGNIDVPVTGVVSDPGGVSADFELPAGFTNQSGTISVETKYGVSTSIAKLNDATGMVCNFDDLNGFDAGNTTATVINSSSLYPGNHGNYARMNVESMPIGDWNDWQAGRRLVLNYFQWVPVGQVNAPAANWAVKFEIYVKNPWSGGCMFLHDWSWGYTSRYEPWKSAATGAYQTTGWVTVTLPLSSFKSKPSTGPTAGIDGTGEAKATVGELIGSSGNNRLGFFFNNALTPVTNFDIAIDNIRVVKIK